MKFKFSLQKVLNLREQEAESAKIKVEFTKKILNELKSLLIEQRNIYFDDRDKLNLCVRKSERENIPIYQVSLDIAQNKMMEIIRSIRDVQSELELYEHTLIETKKNQKKLENLKEKKLEKFNTEEEYRNQKILDEIAGRRYFENHEEEDL